MVWLLIAVGYCLSVTILISLIYRNRRDDEELESPDEPETRRG